MIPYVSTKFSLSMEMSRLTRDGIAEPVSRDQILRRKRGRGNMIFSCSVDHNKQDWQPCPVDPYPSYMYDHTYIPSRSRIVQATQLRNDVSFTAINPPAQGQ